MTELASDNALLVKASQDLLNACAAVISLWDNGDVATERDCENVEKIVKAAVARAKGEA